MNAQSKVRKIIIYILVFSAFSGLIFRAGADNNQNGQCLRKNPETKTLHFTKNLNRDKQSIEQKVKNGCPRTIAGVLAEWSKYSTEGFTFDVATEKAVLSAIIRIVGIGTEDIFVRVYDAGSSSEVFQKELYSLVGHDTDAMSRIREFINPGYISQKPRTISISFE